MQSLYPMPLCLISTVNNPTVGREVEGGGREGGWKVEGGREGGRWKEKGVKDVACINYNDNKNIW